MSTSTFTDAKRIQTSLLSGVEKRFLYWFAARMPERINADHRTILGFVALRIVRAWVLSLSVESNLPAYCECSAGDRLVWRQHGWYPGPLS